MARRLEFTIAVKPFGDAAKKDAAKFTGELRASDSTAHKLAMTLLKTTEQAKKNLSDMRLSGERLTTSFERGFERAGSAVDKLSHKIRHGVSHALEKVKDSFKEAWPFAKGNLLAQGFEKLFEVPGKVFALGSEDIRARQRLSREFGPDAGFMESISKRVAGRAGLDNAASLNALFAIGESVSGTTAGTTFRGKKLSEAQAGKLRADTFGFGAKLFERVATITGASGEEASQLGYLLANAGTGPEGMRGLVGALHLNRAISAQILKSNEKGKLYEFLGAEKAKEFGVQRGKVAGQGTVVDLLLQRSGFTDKAAEDERRKFGYQIKSIGATFETALGEIGSRTLDRITDGLGKGTTLAEKFKNALESPRGKETVEKIGDGIARAAEYAIKLATEVPKFFSVLSAHKTEIEIFAGLFGAAKIAGPVVSLGKSLANAFTGMRGATPIAPLFVSVVGGAAGAAAGGATGLLGKAGAIAAAGVAGYQLGSYLDKKYDISGGLEKGAHILTTKADDLSLPDRVVKRHFWDVVKASVTGNFAEANAKAQADLVQEGVRSFAPPPKITTVTNIQLDRKTIATVVNEHNAEHVQNATAGIPH